MHHDIPDTSALADFSTNCFMTGEREFVNLTFVNMQQLCSWALSRTELSLVQLSLEWVSPVCSDIASLKLTQFRITSVLREEKVNKGLTFVVTGLKQVREQMATGIDNQSSLESKEEELRIKEKRRISVTFTNSVNIPDEADRKSSLSKKYISPVLAECFIHVTENYSGRERSWWRSSRGVSVMARGPSSPPVTPSTRWLLQRRGGRESPSPRHQHLSGTWPPSRPSRTSINKSEINISKYQAPGLEKCWNVSWVLLASIRLLLYLILDPSEIITNWSNIAEPHTGVVVLISVSISFHIVTIFYSVFHKCENK